MVSATAFQAEDGSSILLTCSINLFKMEKTAFGNNFESNRTLVDFLNKEEIKKEDIVAIYEHRGAVHLIYYK